MKVICMEVTMPYSDDLAGRKCFPLILLVYSPGCYVTEHQDPCTALTVLIIDALNIFASVDLSLNFESVVGFSRVPVRSLALPTDAGNQGSREQVSELLTVPLFASFLI